MLKIAALDDEQAYVEKIERLTKEYFAKRDISYVFLGYDNYEKLLWDMEEQGDIDLFLLDVDLNGYSGLRVAKEIRHWDKDCAIVCVTNYVDYAPAAYEVNAFRYILKQAMEEKLSEMYDELYPRLLEKDERYYAVKTDSRMERLYYKNIVYIQKEKKYVMFHMKNGEETRDRKTLDEVEQKLPEKDFMRIDKGCIINLNHLESVKKTDCYMLGGTVLGVSQTRCRALKERVAAFWNIEGDD